MGEMYQRFHYQDGDRDNGTIVIETIQDVEPILKLNRAQKASSDGYTQTRNMRMIARIPLVVCHKWMKEGINVFDPADRAKVEAKLMDPEWAHLRVSDGEIRQRPTREYLRASTGSNK